MPAQGLRDDAVQRADSARKHPKPQHAAPHSPSCDRRSSRSTTSSTASDVPLGSAVAVSDQRLVSAALDAKRNVQWEEILLTSRMGPSRWKYQETAGEFSIYTKQESQRYAVLAVGLVPCSVAELQQLLHTSSQEDHQQLMDGLFDSEFLEGSFVHDVRLSGSVVAPDSSSRLSQLAVKTATFAKSGWLSNHEEWCYLDAEYLAPSGHSFEKLLTTLRPKDVLAGRSSGRSPKFLHNVTMGYKIQVETPSSSSTTCTASFSDGSSEDTSHPSAAAAAAAAATASRRLPIAVRVQFYAELMTPKHFGIPLPTSIATLSERATKARLLRVAKRCPRFSVLVRRRRLAHQVLVDRTRRFPLTNARCVMCDKLLLLAKLCRLCGHGVCESCSSKHEREQAAPQEKRVPHFVGHRTRAALRAVPRPRGRRRVRRARAAARVTVGRARRREREAGGRDPLGPAAGRAAAGVVATEEGVRDERHQVRAQSVGGRRRAQRHPQRGRRPGRVSVRVQPRSAGRTRDVRPRHRGRPSRGAAAAARRGHRGA
ncbi:hypothetical protein PINS_up022083 [Pythium insidiosum]|nr:hypothetical protein PINS_up022083 [Pythium insidiosum]